MRSSNFVVLGLLWCGACATAPAAVALQPSATVQTQPNDEPAKAERLETNAPPVAPVPTLAPVKPAAPAPTPPPPPRTAAKPSTPAPMPPDTLATDLLTASPSAMIKQMLAEPQKYRFQVLYTPVRDGHLERHGFRTDAEYFFPASSMKLPIALAMYDRLAKLRDEGNPAAAAYSRKATARIHPTSGSGGPYPTTLENETWRAIVVSDNSSANRLLGIVGHREAHETLWADGIATARINTGFDTGAKIDPAELSPRVELELADAKAEIAARKSTLVLPATKATGLDIGKGNIVDGRLVNAPLSFAKKNAIAMRELQDVMVRVMRPELLPTNSVADTLSADDRAFLQEALGTLPSGSGIAGFDRNVVIDYQYSPFLRGVERVRDRKQFHIYAKIGQAYGFIVANAYVIDTDTKRGFFLVASVYANPSEILNSDAYAYDSVSLPVLADVAEIFARHAFERDGAH